jgi:hypothetical protein
MVKKVIISLDEHLFDILLDVQQRTIGLDDGSKRIQTLFNKYTNLKDKGWSDDWYEQ